MSANLMSLARSGGKFLKMFGDRKMVRTLPYLRRVAYLEGHGTEWIDTGVVSADNVGVRCEYAYRAKQTTGVVDSNSLFFGCFGSNNRFGLGSNSSNIYHWWNSSKIDGSPRTIDESIELNYKNSRKAVFGSSAFDVVGTLNAATNIALFAGLRMDTHELVFTPLAGKLGNVYISRGTADIQKLITVLDLSGRPAMYDEVSGNLFYNQGTGEFTWGELDSQTT